MAIENSDIKTIIVIDDDIDEFLLIQDAMAIIDPETTVYFADNCEVAKKFKVEEIDLVLLDINMPGKDGFSWLKSIRENGYADLPVIMYTNSLSPFHIEKAYADGANLYYVKPDNFKKLVNGLSRLLNLDWKHPYRVKESYYHHGKFITFS